MADIKSSIEAAMRYLSEHPDEARYTDSVATASLEEGLRFRVTGPGGEETFTDMPTAVGGSGSALSPGWLFRAAVASCVGSVVAMEAARSDLHLSRLDVTVDSESDDRGILGMDPSVPAGPLSMRIAIRVEADGADPKAVEQVVREGVDRCPVADAVQRAVETTIEIEGA
jgi:uncharacterized OsmC-like protein